MQSMIESAQGTPPAMATSLDAVSVPLESEASRTRFAFTGSLRRAAARGTLINGAFTVALGILGLLKGFVLARFLTRADFGLWGIIAVSLSTLLWVKQAGIGDKFVQQDEADQAAAFQRAFTLELAVTAICVILIAAAIPVLVVIYGLPTLVGPSLVVAGALMVSVLQAPLWVYYRRMDFARQRGLAAVGPVVDFAVSVALAVAGAGYWAFAVGMAAGVLATSLAAVLSTPYPLRLRWSRGAMSAYWSFSSPLLLAGGATFLWTWGAVITAKLELGVAAVGVIALADTVAGFTESVDNLVTGTLYPAICAVKDELGLLYESLVKTNRLALIWAVPFGLGLTLFCSDLVRFAIGEQWRPAVVVLQVYGVAAAVNHIGFNWTAYFRALGATRPIAVVSVVASAVFLLTGIPLLLAIGLRGFAIGIALQGLAALLLRAFYLQRIFPGFAFLRHALRSFLPGLSAAAIVLGLRLVDGARTLPRALVELALFLTASAVLTWLLERELLREAMGHLRPVVPAA